MNMDMQRFHATFFEESREGLEAMEAGLLSLEQGNRDGDLINSIFRAAHSIKGGSATFGFDAIAGMTHVLETLLDELRAGQRAVSPPAVDAMLASVDVLRALLAEAEHGTPADPAAVQAIKDRLNAIEHLIGASEQRREVRGACRHLVGLQIHRQDQAGVFGQGQVFRRDIDPLAAQLFNFHHQMPRINHHAIAYDRQLATAHDAAGQ